MHNLKEVRKNFESFKESLKKRSVNVDFSKLENLDKKNREFIQIKENLEKEKKDISKSKDKSLFEKSKKISVEIEKLSEEKKTIKSELDKILFNIPNIPHPDVPIGIDENNNVEVSKAGKIPTFDFKPKTHYELGENLKMLDFDLATKTSGSRFVFVKDKLALLERALSNFMLDTHILKNGYKEISPPLLASADTMFGTGQLPKFENDQFEIKLEEGSDRKFLIPTAEVILTNIVKDKIIDKKDLPMRFVASTPCFRKEAGSYGKDTKGMIRQHQFYKVEMVSIVEQNKCNDELVRMTNCASMILDKLKLPYRKVLFDKEFLIFLKFLPHNLTFDLIRSCSFLGQLY